MSKKPADEIPVDETPAEVPEEELSPEMARTPEEQEITELLDRLMRLQAEYENYRKRIDREKTEWRTRALETLVLDLLPVLDSFDRAIAAATEDMNAASILDGMKLVHRQLEGALRMSGVEPLEGRGEEFDPTLHEAFLTRPVAPGEKAGTIVEEVEKGYRIGNRIVRPTKAVVAVAPEKDTGPEAGPEEE